MSDCGCEADTARAGINSAYRRTLWIVVVLNIGFGLVELAGGFLAGSQALKADSLDFIGDGSITFFGLIALGWPAVARSRAPLVEGAFLAALGGGVLGLSALRGIPGPPPLAVNVSAALMLVRFRDRGDATSRAIWLFSRNDAVANIAVIFAAVLVGWTGQAWPDLVVAGVIALLFLHSAYDIIRDARRELAGHARGVLA